MKQRDAASIWKIGSYLLAIPLLTLPAIWALGISMWIRQRFELGTPQWLLTSMIAALIVGTCWGVGRLLQTDAGRKFGENFMVCLFLPLWAIPFGGIYLWASEWISRGREPFATIILGTGLGITVFGFGIATSMTIPHMLLESAGALSGLLLLRLITRHGMGIMRFGSLHFVTLFAAMTVASMEDKQRKKDGEAGPPEHEVNSHQH